MVSFGDFKSSIDGPQFLAMTDIVVALVSSWNSIVGVDNCMNPLAPTSCPATDTVALYCSTTAQCCENLKIRTALGNRYKNNMLD